MSKPRTVKNYDEALSLIKKYKMSEHTLAMAMVQLTEREKVRVLNNYRSEHGEPLLPTDPPMLPGDTKFVWIVDVPTHWKSGTLSKHYAE